MIFRENNNKGLIITTFPSGPVSLRVTVSLGQTEQRGLMWINQI